MTYAESKAFIDSLPVTWLPALLLHFVKVCLEKKVFVPGGATRLVKSEEIEHYAICPFCEHGKYLIDGRLEHRCIKDDSIPKDA